MENVENITSEETVNYIEALRGYISFFRDNLKKEELELLAERTRSSVSTIYNYIAGAIRDERRAKDILEVGIEILKLRGIEKEA